MFVSVCLPVKVSHFTMFFLAYKKVDYETKCFSLTPDVISTRIKKTKNSVSLSAMIGNNRLFVRTLSSK